MFLESCDPIVPGAPTRRDPTHRINLLIHVIVYYILQGLTIVFPQQKIIITGKQY